MSIEAMKLALEAFKSIDEAMPFPVAKHSMKQLRQAIEQAQKQEPVAHINSNGVVRAAPYPWGDKETLTPLYTAPPAERTPRQPEEFVCSTGLCHYRQPLTDEEIKTRTDEQIEDTFKRCGGRWNGDHWVIEDADLHPFVRTIEGADLNTLRAISDEYNAWIRYHAGGGSYDSFLQTRLAAHGIKENNNG